MEQRGSFMGKWLRLPAFGQIRALVMALSLVMSMILILPGQTLWAANRTDELKGEPKLMVTSIRLDPVFLSAGGEATLTVTINNTNNSRYIKNAIFSFSDAESQIIPVGAASIFVGRIEKGAVYDWSFKVKALPTAKSGIHAAIIEMAYEDNEHQPHTASSRIYLDIRQPVHLIVGEPKFPPRLTQGDTPVFSLALMNLGQSQIRNALLSFKLDGLTHAGSVLVGTIDPGESKDGMANFRVESDRMGTVEGTVTIDYEDDFGQHYTSSVPLKATIEPRVAQKAPEVQKPDSFTVSLTKWLLPSVGIAIFLMLIASVLWFRNARQRQKDEARL